MFLDREPYIQYWRPIYHVIGPFTRFAKALITSISGLFLERTANRLSSVELRLVEIESLQRELQKSQAQFHKMIERLIDLQLEIAAKEANARKAEWGGLERLLMAFMGSSSRESLAPAEMYSIYQPPTDQNTSHKPH
jgi:hypothetical protein